MSWKFQCGFNSFGTGPTDSLLGSVEDNVCWALLKTRRQRALSEKRCISFFWPQYGTLQIGMWPFPWQCLLSAVAFRVNRGDSHETLTLSLQHLPCILISWWIPSVTNQSHMPISRGTVLKSGTANLRRAPFVIRTRLQWNESLFLPTFFFFTTRPLSWRSPLGG